MKVKKLFATLVAVCLSAFLCSQVAFAAYTSDVIDLRPDYKGAVEGVLKAVDYPRNSHIPDTDLDNDYEPWMQAASGDYFTEAYFHEYQVYFKCVLAGVIKEGEDLDLSKVIREGESSGEAAEPVEITLVGKTSSFLPMTSEYIGRFEGILSGAECAKKDGVDVSGEYESWMKMEFGADFDKAAFQEYQLYWTAVDEGVIEAGDDLDLALVLDTEVYSDGSTKVVNSAYQEARYQAMRLPTAIGCTIVLIVVFAATVVVLLRGSNKRYKEFLENGSVEKSSVSDCKNFVRNQIVNLDLFGNAVPVLVQTDEAGEVFRFSYTFDNNKVQAEGKIENGSYILEKDPSGHGKMVLQNIVTRLSNQWD